MSTGLAFMYSTAELMTRLSHCLPDAEHLDMYAGADAVEDVFVHIVDDIERTRQE